MKQLVEDTSNTLQHILATAEGELSSISSLASNVSKIDDIKLSSKVDYFSSLSGRAAQLYVQAVQLHEYALRRLAEISR